LLVGSIAARKDIYFSIEVKKIPIAHKPNRRKALLVTGTSYLPHD
jgi:hypothetical protein